VEDSELFQRVVHGELLEHLGLAGLPDLPGQEHLVHHRVHLVEVEHQVQLAHVVKVLVEHLHKVVDGLEVVQVVVAHVHTDAKVEAGVPPVDDLEVSKLDKVGVLLITDSDDCMHLLYQLLLLLVVKVHVPLGQPRLPRPVLDHYKPDHLNTILRVKCTLDEYFRLTGIPSGTRSPEERYRVFKREDRAAYIQRIFLRNLL